MGNIIVHGKVDPEYDANIACIILNSYDYNFTDYNSIYQFSNEQIKKYYNYIDLTDSNVLSVTSSFDHALHALLAGASNIDTFDINKLAKYYAALKVALIKTYDYVHFKKKFTNPNGYLTANLDLKELSNELSFEEQKFWETLLKEKNFGKNSWKLFRNDGYLDNIKDRCAYFDQGTYYALKSKLQDFKFNCYDLDISDKAFTNEITGIYDAIFISNILEYYERISTKNRKKYAAITENCSKLLNDNGGVYDFHCKSEPKPIRDNFLTYRDKIITHEAPGEITGVLVYQKKVS